MLFVILLDLLCFSTASFVTVDDQNAYQGVVISVERSDDLAQVSCSEYLVMLENVITNSSAMMITSVGKRFGNVTVILPREWANCTEAENPFVPWPRIAEADFKMTSRHPNFDWRPYVLQYGQCGDPGLTVQVPNAFLMDENISMNSKGNVSLRLNDIDWKFFMKIG